MGCGSLAFAREPLLVMPVGMQVFGSKPWFCMKKMTRLGVVVVLGEIDSADTSSPVEAHRCAGSNEPPTAAPTPAAIPCSMFLRLSIIDLSTRITVMASSLVGRGQVKIVTATAPLAPP